MIDDFFKNSNGLIDLNGIGMFGILKYLFLLNWSVKSAGIDQTVGINLNCHQIRID